MVNFLVCIKMVVFYRDYETFQWDNFSDCIKAPLWQQVIDFIWEKYNILINAYQIPNDKVIWQVLYEFCPTKEQAISKVIELCKKKQ